MGTICYHGATQQDSWYNRPGNTINTYISVTNFEDPIYSISTNGLITNSINKTPYEVPIAIGNLPDHVENSYYIAHSDAPSFLNRLEGNLSDDANGIESLVYLPRLPSPEIKSCVDYIYFSTDNPATSGVSGMPSWFKLDTPHLSVYG